MLQESAKGKWQMALEYNGEGIFAFLVSLEKVRQLEQAGNLVKVVTFFAYPI